MDDLASESSTTTGLLRIDPVTPGFASYGVTVLDQDITYNDGLSLLTYRAAIGMIPHTIIHSSDMAIDNSETAHLLPEFDIPELNEADIRAGAYDYATFRFYLVNYEDLSQGHVQLHGGTIGQVSIRSDGLSFVNELRGLVAQLKQSLCEKDSLSCRAIFGSQPTGSLTPGPQVSFGWCGFDATTLLESGEVADVGLETTLSFQVSDSAGWSADHLAPGVVKFLTGSNAGRTFEIDSNTDDGWITLQHETGFEIGEGDQLEYRPDCSKVARDDVKGCRHHFGAEWVLHLRAEPDIPVADEGALQTPGATVGPGGGGTTNVPFTEQA
jgi:uncharacterized phage protein (TIGR02218 family)